MILTKILTPRLLLRPFSDSEVVLMQQLDLDVEVVRYLGHGKIKSLEESEKNLMKIQNDYKLYGLGLFAAFEKSSGHFVGRCGLIPWILDDILIWEIGYSFKRSAWGKGFATEASQSLSDWAEANLNVPFVISLIHPYNHASKHVAEKIGMKWWKEISINDLNLVAYRKEFS
jgi:RimJ/RimL family protein N-acetyltransferase